MGSPCLWGPNNTAILLENLPGFKGNKNYLSVYTPSTSSGVANVGNGDAEFGNTTGWSLGTIGTLTNGLPTGSPTFGSGANGNLALSTVSSSQLSGTYSFSLASSTATVQGNMMASSAFYIDLEDQAKVLQFKCYYSTASGVANGNYSGTSSSTLGVAFYDVTNSVWLSSAGNFNFVQNSGTGYATGTVQTGSSTTQIRVCFYFPAASGGAITWYLDDIFIGPQTAPSGPVMTDWVAYTPTFSAGFGTVSAVSFYSRRVGDSLMVYGNWTNGTVAGSVATITVGYNGANGNVTIDTSKIGANSIIGVAETSLSSTTYFSTFPVAPSSNATTINFIIKNSTTGFSGGVQNGNAICSNTTVNTVHFVVPIVGWSSNTVQSSDTDSRIIALSAIKNSGSAANNENTVTNWTSVLKDSAGAFNSTTGVYTVPVTGFYAVSGTVGFAANSTGVRYARVVQAGSLAQNYSGIFVNNNGAGNATWVSASAIVYCLSGDSLSINGFQNSGGSLAFDGTSGATTLSIQRISGPAVTQATESVNGRYFSSVTAISGSLGNITYATKTRDSHGAYSGATWTCPVTGMYLFNAGITIQGTFALNSTVDLQIVQAGSASQISEQIVYSGGVETNVSANVSDEFYCLAGDTIIVKASTSATGSPAIVSSNNRNFFSWSRIGN
jgi:hypothetical protein